MTYGDKKSCLSEAATACAVMLIDFFDLLAESSQYAEFRLPNAIGRKTLPQACEPRTKRTALESSSQAVSATYTEAIWLPWKGQ